MTDAQISFHMQLLLTRLKDMCEQALGRQCKPMAVLVFPNLQFY